MNNDESFMDEIKKFSLGSTKPSKNTSPEFEKKCMAFQIKWLEDCIMELKQSNQWQPIETAPMNGTYILVFQKHSDRFSETMIARYSQFSECWFIMWDDRATEANPTHWMPLPQPPTNK